MNGAESVRIVHRVDGSRQKNGVSPQVGACGHACLRSDRRELLSGAPPQGCCYAVTRSSVDQPQTPPIQVIDELVSAEDMARNLAQFRGMLVEELSQHPIAFAMDDDEEDDDDDAAAAAR